MSGPTMLFLTGMLLVVFAIATEFNDRIEWQKMLLHEIENYKEFEPSKTLRDARDDLTNVGLCNRCGMGDCAVVVERTGPFLMDKKVCVWCLELQQITEYLKRHGVRRLR